MENEIQQHYEPHVTINSDKLKLKLINKLQKQFKLDLSGIDLIEFCSIMDQAIKESMHYPTLKEIEERLDNCNVALKKINEDIRSSFFWHLEQTPEPITLQAKKLFHSFKIVDWQ